MINTLIRWWYLTFFKKRCVHLLLENDWYDIGHVIYAVDYSLLLYLGKDWYLMLKKI